MSPSRIPALGPHGEGWVAGQFVLLGMAGVLGAREQRLPPSGALGWLRVTVGAAALVGGLLVGRRALRDLGSSLTPLPHPREDAELVEDGIYGRIRHPMYAALVLASAGWSVVSSSFGAAVGTGALAIWLDLKARREEQWLTDRFESYPEYRRRTHRFIPGAY